MSHSLSAIGVLFDISKIESGSYGIQCWKVFWKVVAPDQLKGAQLFEGDVNVDDNDNVFCIAVQNIDEAIIRMIKLSLVENVGYGKICAKPNFVEGERCIHLSLPVAGRIDFSGNLVGDAWNARDALDSL